MATINVSNATQLASALSAASGGDTIVLANGSYGDITIGNDFSSDVTLVAAEPQGAQFGKVTVTGSHVALQDVEINGAFIIESADSISVFDSRLTSYNAAKYSSNITFVGNDIGGGFTQNHGLNFGETSNFRIADNYIHEVMSDILRITGNSSGGVVENNVMYDSAPSSEAGHHPDTGLQMFGTASGTPHDIVIRGNLIVDDPATGDFYGQGIFLGGPTGGYHNIVIEENLVAIGSPNAIFVRDGFGVEIKNNTVIPWPGGGGGGNIVLVNDVSGVTVDGNVTKGIVDTEAWNEANVQENFVYSTDPSSPAYIGDLISGEGYVWQDFLPQSGSAIDFGSGYGALGRLAELLSGEAPAPTPLPGSDEEPAPEPTPEPIPDPGLVVPPEAVDGAVFSMMGAHAVSGAGDVKQFAHVAELELRVATIALGFNADNVSGRKGILTKDAIGTGDHFAAFIENGTLFVRFQNGSDEKILSVDGITAGRDYALQVTFGDGTVAVLLDGVEVDRASLEADWARNTEIMQIGGLGWASESGEAGFGDPFDGTISDVVIVEGHPGYDAVEAIRSGASIGPGTDVGTLVGGMSEPEDLAGTPGSDMIRGAEGDDTLTGGAGDDTLDGGHGWDTAAYSGDRSSYTVTLSTSHTDVKDRRSDGDGTDRLSSVEALGFLDEDWPLAPVSDLAVLSEADFESFVEMYIAYFDRAPDAEGLYFWGAAFANGLSLEEMAACFLDQDETRATYPDSLSNADFVSAVYENVLGRRPDSDGHVFWVELLDAGTIGRDVFALEVLQGAKALASPGAPREFKAQKAADIAYLAAKTDLGIYYAVTKGMSDIDNARMSMELFDGTEASVTATKDAIDDFHAGALDPESGAFLLPLVGVIDDPFAA